MIIRNLTPLSILMEKEDQKRIEEIKVGIGLAEYSCSNLIKSYILDSKSFIHKITEIGLNYSIDLQVYNPTYLILPNQLYYAINYATLAFYNNKNISKSPLVEYLLYASGQKQIHIALDLVGFSHNEQNKKFAYTIVAKNLETIKKVNADLKQLLDINEIELDRVQYSLEQLKIIQKKLEISEFQLQNALNIINLSQSLSINENPAQTLEKALLNCIREKMAFLIV